MGKARPESRGILDILLWAMRKGVSKIFFFFSVEQEGLAPGGFTERKHLDLTIIDTPLGELKMYSSDGGSTSITCATATKHVQKTSWVVPAVVVAS